MFSMRCCWCLDYVLSGSSSKRRLEEMFRKPLADKLPDDARPRRVPHGVCSYTASSSFKVAVQCANRGQIFHLRPGSQYFEPLDVFCSPFGMSPFLVHLPSPSQKRNHSVCTLRGATYAICKQSLACHAVVLDRASAAKLQPESQLPGLQAVCWRITDAALAECVGVLPLLS